MSLVGWNDSEIMYSKGKTEIAPNTIATAQSCLLPRSDTEQSGLRILRSSRRERRVVGERSSSLNAKLTVGPRFASRESEEC